MNTMKRKGLRMAAVILAGMACLPIARLFAEDAKTPAAKPPAAGPPPAAAPTQEAIGADLQAAGEAMQKIIGSPQDLMDVKKRSEVAPKAIPAIKKFVALFDEMAQQNAGARAQSAQMH